MEVEIQIQTDKSTFYENFAEISAIGLTVIRTKKKKTLLKCTILKACTKHVKS
jgi:hypothetical protein